MLKKKHNWNLFHGKKAGGCDACGTTLPSGQSASAQSLGSGQTLGSTQAYSAPQAGWIAPRTASATGTSAPIAPVMEPPAAPATEAPAAAAAPAAAVPATPPAPNGLQLLPSGSGN